MPSVLAYHRPRSLEDAQSLLARRDHVLLAGGTLVVPASRRFGDRGVSLVDLQALGLDTVTVEDDRLVIGAMVRLGDLLVDDRVAPLLAELCRRELPSTLRNAATIGGTVGAAESDSVLLAGLLVHEARLVRHGADDATPLASATSDDLTGRIVVSISVANDGQGAIVATGRTPADVPIVAAVGRRSETGVRVALTGVADTPILVDPDDPTAGLSPPSDFRGTADYRLHLASTLVARVTQELTP